MANGTWPRGKRFVVLGAVVAALLGALVGPQRAAAHPLGNFTVNQYSRVEVTADGPRIVYVLDLAEVPAFQEMRVIDADGDGSVSEAEEAAYLLAKLAEIERGLRPDRRRRGRSAATNRNRAVLPRGSGRARRSSGCAPPSSLETALVFSGGQQATSCSRTATPRTGSAGARSSSPMATGSSSTASTVPATDTSDELRAYPDDLLGSPARPDAAATFAVAHGHRRPGGGRLRPLHGRDGRGRRPTRRGPAAVTPAAASPPCSTTENADHRRDRPRPPGGDGLGRGARALARSRQDGRRRLPRRLPRHPPPRGLPRR